MLNIISVYSTRLVFLYDLVIFVITPVVALWMRSDFNNHHAVFLHFYSMMYHYLVIFVLVKMSIFYFSGVYRRLWRYASISELLILSCALIAGAVVVPLVLFFIGVQFPMSVFFITLLLDLLFIGSSRIAIRVVYHFLRYGDMYNKRLNSNRTDNILIVGAGDAGVMIAKEFHQRYRGSKNVIGFVDDDIHKHGKVINGYCVLGRCLDIHDLVEKYAIDEIVVAMPSVEGRIVREIIAECKETGCEIKVSPGLYEIINGKVSVQQLRNVGIEDLLRREAISVDLKNIGRYLKEKVVLVTGAGGSIGSEICRQVAKLHPSCLVMLGKGENSIFEISQEIMKSFSDLQQHTVIVDVKDAKQMDEVFARFRPQVVFHAAAHKHVPLMEGQPWEAVQNNVVGTFTVANLAKKYKSEVFVLISTDKAVNPTNVMGATKRLAEMILQGLHSENSKTRFAVVRFGNVLGSRGSVVPIFKKQIENGGPVTITHPDIKRYFMTIPEACQLVLQAGSMAQGGEVFVLDMGEPVKIVDLARDMITLMGLVPEEDIEIKFTGLRPGEKLFEELLLDGENTKVTECKQIFIANLHSEYRSLEDIVTAVDEMRGCTDDLQGMKNKLKNLVPEYQIYSG